MVQGAVKICILLFSVCLSVFPVRGDAQEINDRQIVDADSLTIGAPPDSVMIQAALMAADSVVVRMGKASEAFKPNSTKAVLWSVIPGMGQIYNRKYWKLPLVYGGFMGFMYAVTWNGKNYQDYWSAYKSIMADAQAYNQLLQEANGTSVVYEFDKAWTDFLPSADHKTVVNNATYQNLFKSRKDFYRRNRDLSIILTVGFYFICMIDAYVDAELFDFDISPDLSMRVEPVVSPQTRFSAQNIGVNCSITF
ncbi:MAG: DUF5683 domain-containing protein [Tannerellaceae bacterium]|jgi:hypothetical protein|nr:DUF5683 domain-containing protein [Tannerellaceae bacterium]